MKIKYTFDKWTELKPSSVLINMNWSRGVLLQVRG